MHIYDISVCLSESVPVWPGDPGIRITHASHIDRGDAYTVSRLDLGAHTGTHVDAPAHFISGGVPIDGLDLGVLVGPVQVVHALDAEVLTAAVLDRLGIPPCTERILFRTRNSERWARGEAVFDSGFVAISPDGARWLVERGVRLVGIDYLSVGSWAEPAATHQILLGENVIAVEGLDLSGIEPGVYFLVCLPIRLKDGDGAPARAILIEGLL